MATTCTVRDEMAVAVLSERIDGFTAPELQAALDPPLANPAVRFAVLDMSAVKYLSSAGIRVFLSAHRKLTGRQGFLALAGMQDYCADVISLTGFAQAWPAFATVADAVRHCRAKPAPAPEWNSPSAWAPWESAPRITCLSSEK